MIHRMLHYSMDIVLFVHIWNVPRPYFPLPPQKLHFSNFSSPSISCSETSLVPGSKQHSMKFKVFGKLSFYLIKFSFPINFPNESNACHWLFGIFRVEKNQPKNQFSFNLDSLVFLFSRFGLGFCAFQFYSILRRFAFCLSIKWHCK